MRERYHIGIDIGSTTLKAVVSDEKPEKVFTYYARHNANIRASLAQCFTLICQQIGDVPASLRITGSIGIGVAEKCAVPFTQEVVAAARYVSEFCPRAATMIDIGGEDAKVVLFADGKPQELRMNGNCAGGTGAFIDQMAILMGVSIEELNGLALAAEHIYPIASRCGVFCKTDIQNLIAKNASRADIARSIFHAVAVQTVTTLAHGQEIVPPLLFVGGPLTFIPALRQAFTDFLKISADDCILPEEGSLIPAYGTTLCDMGAEDSVYKSVREWGDHLSRMLGKQQFSATGRLQRLFQSEEDYLHWKADKGAAAMEVAQWREGGQQRITLGIDSGSTTTKIIALDADSGGLLFNYYSPNLGNSVATVEKGLRALLDEATRRGSSVTVVGSCSTGYGEDLIRTAFGLDEGMVETMAHYLAARHINPNVSFILDIGGQDMKAIFVSEGIINRIEINEACSSGCGSFIETFAKSLRYSLGDFVSEAVKATAPCDLGTRCTVFMNSKVKQVLREGASVADLSAGLSYSVVKNCLYKVLKLKDIESLGRQIVLQGGTMRNDAVVRAFELLTGREAYVSDRPELMGAYGCALHAAARSLSCCREVALSQMLRMSRYKVSQLQCRGCENNCLVMRYTFDNGKRYFSGNRCERVFTNRGADTLPGHNAYIDKIKLLFSRNLEISHPRLTVGIPRVLNIYEEYPFWHTLFTRCGIQVRLSSPSRLDKYEATAKYVMADNICFPAKLVHSHIAELAQGEVDRIFMPFVVHEANDRGQNSFNCPIVSGYSQVIQSVQNLPIPLDSPVISFKDSKALTRQCIDYLGSLGVESSTARKAIGQAIREQENFQQTIAQINEEILQEATSSGQLTVMLAGRPYHSDPLIQHKLSDIVASMGVNVITDDIVRAKSVDYSDTRLVSQWAYPNRILKAAKWVAQEGGNIQFMQLTSFGCGPDSFILDEIRDLLHRYGKALTLLKVDDVTNIGSLRLRVRSAIESIKMHPATSRKPSAPEPFVNTPIFGKDQKWRKIIAPFFTPFISPLIPSVMKLAGYDVEILPISDTASAEWGLSYANNEVCYPATLIVGDIVKAFKDGSHKAEECAVAITQTGGQCRASNYIALIKRALVDAGYPQVPVVSLSFGGNLGNEQPGFKFPWLKLMPIVMGTLLYSDSIAKMYYASVVREASAGQAEALRTHYLDLGKIAIEHNKPEELLELTAQAAADFNAACCEKECPRTGIVGEIFLKFNAFAQKDLTNWLISQGIEVVPPLLTNFFLQSFVNFDVKRKNGLVHSHMPQFVLRALYHIVWKNIVKYNAVAGEFRFFVPFADIYTEAEKAERVINLQAQFGEGWLLSAEILSLYESGVTNVVSAQPFGCIANQIISKGIEHRLRRECPGIRILSLDFDSGVSDANVTNRLLLFTSNIVPSASFVAAQQ